MSDLRRAAIDAGTNASFLASGTAQLTDGTGKLRSGGDQLAAGVTELNDGSPPCRRHDQTPGGHRAAGRRCDPARR
ncbi:hypothetical protein [Corynebacterium sp. Marseille-Q2516]